MKSSSTELLKGTKWPGDGKGADKTIRSISKGDDWANKRVVTFTDGSKLTTNRVALRAAIDVELDRQIGPKMMDTLVKHRDGTATVRIGGEVMGENKDYASVAGAKVALQKHYSQDFEKYKEMRADGDGKRCRKRRT